MHNETLDKVHILAFLYVSFLKFLMKHILRNENYWHQSRYMSTFLFCIGYEKFEFSMHMKNRSICTWIKPCDDIIPLADLSRSSVPSSLCVFQSVNNMQYLSESTDTGAVPASYLKDYHSNISVQFKSNR